MTSLLSHCYCDNFKCVFWPREVIRTKVKATSFHLSYFLVIFANYRCVLGADWSARFMVSVFGFIVVEFWRVYVVQDLKYVNSSLVGLVPHVMSS